MSAFMFSGLKHCSCHHLQTSESCFTHIVQLPGKVSHSLHPWPQILSQYPSCQVHPFTPNTLDGLLKSGTLKAGAATKALFRALKALWLQGVHTMYFLVEDQTIVFPIPFNLCNLWPTPPSHTKEGSQIFWSPRVQSLENVFLWVFPQTFLSLQALKTKIWFFG